MTEPDSIIEAFDEMRRAEQVLEAAHADWLAKRAAMILLFEQTYAAETDPLPERKGP